MYWRRKKLTSICSWCVASCLFYNEIQSTVFLPLQRLRYTDYREKWSTGSGCTAEKQLHYPRNKWMRAFFLNIILKAPWFSLLSCCSDYTLLLVVTLIFFSYFVSLFHILHAYIDGQCRVLVYWWMRTIFCLKKPGKRARDRGFHHSPAVKSDSHTHL